jgi:hypothetical protein
MKIRASLLIMIGFLIVFFNAGCVRTAATWQPGMQMTTISATQATVNPDYAVDMMLFTPGEQSGKTLTATYAINPASNGVICKLSLERLEPGDTGTISWAIKNTIMSESELNLRAILTPAPAGANGAANYIGIKLISNDMYYLGDSATYVPLANLKPYLQNRPQILASGATVNFRMEWQVAKNPANAGLDGTFGTTDDISVDGKTILQDKTDLDINFSLTPWR